MTPLPVHDRRDLSSDQNTSPHTLTVLANDTDFEVRADVADNPAPQQTP